MGNSKKDITAKKRRKKQYSSRRVRSQLTVVVMLLPFILITIGLITAYLFRSRFVGGDAEATVVESVKHSTKPSQSMPKAKESLSSIQSIDDTKSVSLIPLKVTKQVTSSVLAAPQLSPVGPSASTNTAVPRVGPTDSESRAIVENLETRTPQAEQFQPPASISTSSGQTSTGGSSGSDDTADPTGKKKKKPKSKKTSKHSKKDGKDKKKKKKKSLEQGEAPKT